MAIRDEDFSADLAVEGDDRDLVAFCGGIVERCRSIFVRCTGRRVPGRIGNEARADAAEARAERASPGGADFA